MEYISKAYLKEKFEDLSWAMEYLFSSTDGDSISEDDVRTVADTIWTSTNAIIKELGI